MNDNRKLKSRWTLQDQEKMEVIYLENVLKQKRKTHKKKNHK